MRLLRHRERPGALGWCRLARHSKVALRVPANTVDAPAWRGYWFGHIAAAREFPYPQGCTTGVVWQARGDVEEEIHFLQRISADAKHPRATGAEADYLALLDRCLLDRVISVSEAMQLASAAEELGFSRFEVQDLHAEHYRALAQAAWADGVVTDDEQSDLDAVAELLRIPGEGDDELRSLGLTPHGAITKKVRLLVAADPDTLSGKAKKARDYGIPIVNEDGLRRLLV